MLGDKWVVLDTPIDFSQFMETSDADNFLNWHDDAHTKKGAFIYNKFICGSYTDNINISFSTLPAVERGFCKHNTVIRRRGVLGEHATIIYCSQRNRSRDLCCM